MGGTRYREIVESALSQSKHRINETEKRYQELVRKDELLEKVNAFFQQVIEFKTKETRQFIKQTVNKGLAFIFDDKISIDIQSSIKNNKMTYSIVVVDENGRIGDKEAYGGGVMAVISFLLRFTVHFLNKQYPLMVLDESLTFVSEDYQERLSLFIKEITDKFGYDLLLISHQPKLNVYADRVYKVEKRGNISKVIQISDNG